MLLEVVSFEEVRVVGFLVPTVEAILEIFKSMLLQTECSLRLLLESKSSPNHNQDK